MHNLASLDADKTAEKTAAASSKAFETKLSLEVANLSTDLQKYQTSVEKEFFEKSVEALKKDLLIQQHSHRDDNQAQFTALKQFWNDEKLAEKQRLIDQNLEVITRASIRKQELKRKVETMREMSKIRDEHLLSDLKHRDSGQNHSSFDYGRKAHCNFNGLEGQSYFHDVDSFSGFRRGQNLHDRDSAQSAGPSDGLGEGSRRNGWDIYSRDGHGRSDIYSRDGHGRSDGHWEGLRRHGWSYKSRDGYGRSGGHGEGSRGHDCSYNSCDGHGRSDSSREAFQGHRGGDGFYSSDKGPGEGSRGHRCGDGLYSSDKGHSSSFAKNPHDEHRDRDRSDDRGGSAGGSDGHGEGHKKGRHDGSDGHGEGHKKGRHDGGGGPPAPPSATKQSTKQSARTTFEAISNFYEVSVYLISTGASELLPYVTMVESMTKAWMDVTAGVQTLRFLQTIGKQIPREDVVPGEPGPPLLLVLFDFLQKMA